MSDPLCFGMLDYLPIEEVPIGSIVIVGIPSDKGATSTPGQSLATTSIRQAGCDVKTTDHRYGVYDVGDIADDDIESLIYLMQRCLRVIVLGGDDSINVLVSEASRRVHGRLHLCHLDAHKDICSGDNDHATWVRDAHKNFSSVQICGSRDHGHSKEDLRLLKKKKFSLARKPTILKKMFLAIDIDVCDPAFAPAVAYPEPGGLTSTEIIEVLDLVYFHAPIVTLTEVTPALDSRHSPTSLLAARLVQTVIIGSPYGE